MLQVEIKKKIVCIERIFRISISCFFGHTEAYFLSAHRCISYIPLLSKMRRPTNVLLVVDHKNMNINTFNVNNTCLVFHDDNQDAIWHVC